ncbi:hypothetical protein VTI28DRAFT_9124 [Corynascus sepedonium]
MAGTKGNAAAQAATLDKFIKGWSSWTPEGFLATWADGCTQQNLPFSSKVPIKTRPDVEHLFPHLMSILTNFEFKVHNVVHDVAAGKACIYALTKADAPWGPYSNEHALFLWFDESGEKVTKIEELFDNVVMNDVLPRIHQELARRNAAANGTNEANGV